MIALLIAAASVSADPIAACSTAMRGLGSVPASTILQACPAPVTGRDPFTAEASLASCDGALGFARDAATTAQGLPAVMARGILAKFEAMAAECKQPEAPKPLPPTDCSQAQRLWC